MKLLRENNIQYICWDAPLRTSQLAPATNEAIHKAYFEMVFDDTENKYNQLKIYKVPQQ